MVFCVACHPQRCSVCVAGTTWMQSWQRCIWRTSRRGPRATCLCWACCPSAPFAGSWSPSSSWTWASSCQGSTRWVVPIMPVVLVLLPDPMMPTLTLFQIYCNRVHRLNNNLCLNPVDKASGQKEGKTGFHRLLGQTLGSFFNHNAFLSPSSDLLLCR